MKTRILSVIVFVAALGGFPAGPLPAAPQKPASKAYSVQAVTRDGATVVKVGSADSTVCRWLGEPSRRLGDDLWVYFHFAGSREEAREAGCSTLLLTFANGRVADIKLINEGALGVIVAQTNVHPVIGQHMFVAEK
ncbi:MAG TPA: hypothetical protein VLW52_12345 [Opitutaceae bacterium]|nr:hypothetical protein [Opitutaceae bacterium]